MIGSGPDSVEQILNVNIKYFGQPLDHLIGVGGILPDPDNIEARPVGDHDSAVAVEDIAAGCCNVLDADAVALRELGVFRPLLDLQKPEADNQNGDKDNDNGGGDVEPFFKDLQFGRVNLGYAA